ncbi:5-formyltetrahydrofolate cyclo-ligase [Coralloluteibacterium stylophorae]|uniref:5-formyltetrahydrofolate cyclo-ligase n=1 Tax=Coralloluteibacterium stylophorae TaxID=1776034 RepID=UPI0030843A30
MTLPPSSDDRAGLRRRLRAERSALAAPARMQAAEAVAAQLRAHPAFATSGYIAGYWAIGGELPLHAVLATLPEGCVYCLPKLHPDGHLVFAPWRFGDALVSNRFGIPEPDVDPSSCLDAELLMAALVPVVGFDRSGTRLGTGGGWYDRSFAFRHERPAPPWLIGVAYGFQEVDGLVAETWDVPLDAVATPEALIVTGATTLR